MANYCTLINIAIAHEYFLEGICRVLEFKPTPIAAKLIQRNNFLLRPTQSGFSIIGEDDASAKFDEPFRLRFLAYSRDPHFSLYTAQLVENDELLYFSTLYVQEQKLISSGCSDDLLDADCSFSRQIVQPLFIVDIHVTADLLVAAEKKTSNFFIHFHAHMLHWKYYFFGDLAKFDLEVYDLSATSGLVFTSEEKLDEHGCKVFISELPILLSEMPKQRFQLKDKNNSGKVLIKRLPNAGVNCLGKELKQDGRSFIVAEIYVNQ